ILQSLDFSEGPWEESDPVTGFLVMNSTSQLPPVVTKVYLLWDDENLYVGYENFDSDVPDIDKEGYRGNSNQTFLTGDPEGTIKGYFTNPIAEKMFFIQEPDSGSATSDDMTWETNAKMGSDRSNAILAVPFSSIGVDPNETDKLMGLFFRNYPNK